MTAAELIERADMSLADLTSVGGVGGGVLVPEQADAFLDIIYDEPTIFKDARQERMLAPIKNINRIGFNSRLMHATPGENLALSPVNRSKPNLSELQLIAKDYVGEVDIPYNVLTDSLERGNFETHLMTHIAKRVAVDLALFALEGDTLSPDPDLAVQDGWLKLSSSHTVDAAGATISEDLMNRWYKAVPGSTCKTTRAGACTSSARSLSIGATQSRAG
jgi:HK97 family phage major capsid protein